MMQWRKEFHTWLEPGSVNVFLYRSTFNQKKRQRWWEMMYEAKNKEADKRQVIITTTRVNEYYAVLNPTCR